MAGLHGRKSITAGWASPGWTYGREITQARWPLHTPGSPRFPSVACRSLPSSIFTSHRSTKQRPSGDCWTQTQIRSENPFYLSVWVDGTEIKSWTLKEMNKFDLDGLDASVITRLSNKEWCCCQLASLFIYIRITHEKNSQQGQPFWCS